MQSEALRRTGRRRRRDGVVETHGRRAIEGTFVQLEVVQEENRIQSTIFEEMDVGRDLGPASRRGLVDSSHTPNSGSKRRSGTKMFRTVRRQKSMYLDPEYSHIEASHL